jgi:hypothetical protein
MTDIDTVSVQSLNLSIVSLVFAVLYGISSLGQSPDKHQGWSRAEGLARETKKLAVTIAFTGILVSFSLAWVAHLVHWKYSDLGGMVPVGLFFLWWYYERRSSPGVDFDALDTSLNRDYESVILANVGKVDSANSGMSSTQEDLLYSICVGFVSTRSDFLPEAINRIIPNKSVMVSVKALETVARSFTFSRDRFDLIVDDLRRQKLLPLRISTESDS